MLLKSDKDDLSKLHNIITNYYYNLGRKFIIYEHEISNEFNDNDYYVRWLLDRKYVFEYRITEDRGMALSIVSKAIGPKFFTPYDFWDYDNAERFNMNVDEISILNNLKLIDEFIAINSFDA